MIVAHTYPFLTVRRTSLDEAYDEQYRHKEEYNETFVPKTKAEGQHDPVNKPSHYVSGRSIEPISVIEDWDLGFNTGNALKYISRIDRKLNSIEDLEKAIWYLKRELIKRGKV